MPLKQKHLSLLLAIVLVLSPPSKAEDFTTIDVVETALSSSDCLDWCVIGICFWLRCTLFGCEVLTSPRISHNLPDLVVSSFRDFGENPYVEARTVHGSIAASAIQQLLGAVTGGSAPQVESEGQDQTLRFFEVNAVGNPALQALSYVPSNVSYLCPSDVAPLKPYYLSEVDALAWRSSELEAFRSESLIPGRREIGNWPTNTWGAIYPRTGFVHQGDPPKAAAVAAQRAVDILSRSNQTGHIYNHFGPASNEKQDKWQMIIPRPSDQCEAFGASGEWARGKFTEDGDYAWNYWRNYECCIPKAGVFLFWTPIPEICI